MKKLILIFIASIITQIGNSQDTYSIVAIDTITGEVGSAGASCVDLIYYNEPDVGFLSELFPNLGAINTQAVFNSQNQNNAGSLLELGESPSQIIDWLKKNDAEGDPGFRQYGIVGMVQGPLRLQLTPVQMLGIGRAPGMKSLVKIILFKEMCFLKKQ